MCSIVFAWQWCEGVPLVLAANRDEGLTRPSDPPLQLQDEPPLWGGRDRLAGGTWLAVDPRGRVGAVTNRHPGGLLPPPHPTRRSRGELPLALLAGGSDESAGAAMAGLLAAAYNPVNALFVSRTSARWVGLDDVVGRVETALEPGIHVLTEQNVDDTTSPKTVRLRELAEHAAGQATGADELLERFRALLRSHIPLDHGPESAPCIHESEFGTVSSATVLITRDSVQFAHAEGPPCLAAYRPVTMR